MRYRFKYSWSDSSNVYMGSMSMSVPVKSVIVFIVTNFNNLAEC